VLDSPHSGEHYPDDFDHAPPRAVVRQAEDTHVARLYRSAPRLGATLIEAVFPRAYIDANRSLDDLDPGMLAGTWPIPLAASRKTEQGIGLCGGYPRRHSTYARKMSVDEVQRRISALVPAVSRGARYRYDLHRMPSRAVHQLPLMPAVGDANADDPGRARADFSRRS
jgi:N-formylglutamate deformylase